MKLALGYLEMTPEEFWDFTPRLLQMKLEGKREHDEMLQRFEWERMRFQTICLINKDRKRQNQIKLTDLMTFEWEKKAKIKTSKKDRNKAMYLIQKAQKEAEKKKGESSES